MQTDPRNPSRTPKYKTGIFVLKIVLVLLGGSFIHALANGGANVVFERAVFLAPLGIIAAVIFISSRVYQSQINLAQRKSELGPLCSHCHYSLRGNTSGCCPECGLMIVA